MSAPTIKKFSLKERPTASDLNTIYSTLAGKFGSLAGNDFFFPLIMQGDIDLAGNRLLRVREMFGILNMEEFGTDENGFENAINSIENGGVIVLPRNTTVNLSRGIKIRGNRSRIYIVGSGHSSVIKMANNSDDTAIVVDGCFRFRIMNLMINGNRANMNSGHGIHCRNCDDFEITNVWVGDSSTTGVKSHGMLMEGCKHFSIKRNWIRYHKSHGIRCDDSCDDFNISQNFISQYNSSADPDNYSGRGIHVTGNSKNFNIIGNTVQDISWGGIFVQESSFGRVAYNTVRRFGYDTTTYPDGYVGVNLAGDQGSPAEGISVVGNTVTGANGVSVGIGVGAFVNDFTVLGNYCRGQAKPLRYWGGSNSRGTFSGNMVMDIPNNGRTTFTAAKSVTIVDTGVTYLPIQAIHATWDVFPPSNVKGCVLGARYVANSGKIYFYNSSALAGSNDAWYTAEV